jgi:hypothetical protein
MRARSHDHLLADAALRAALVDPETGLPNAAYFQLICEWELQRAGRKEPRLQVALLTISGGDANSRRALARQLPLVFRRSDLIAAGSPRTYQLLFTTPEAEHLDIVRERVGQIVQLLNTRYADAPPLEIHVDLADEPQATAKASDRPGEAPRAE